MVTCYLKGSRLATCQGGSALWCWSLRLHFGRVSIIWACRGLNERPLNIRFYLWRPFFFFFFWTINWQTSPWIERGKKENPCQSISNWHLCTYIHTLPILHACNGRVWDLVISLVSTTQMAKNSKQRICWDRKKKNQVRRPRLVLFGKPAVPSTYLASKGLNPRR